MSIRDRQIQILSAKTHVQSDGSNIGGVDPAQYGYVHIFQSDDLLLWTQGTSKAGGYPAFMWYPAAVRPILPNTGNVRMSFTATISGDMPSVNVRETDLEIVTGGFRYNMSAQYNQAKGWQISDKNGDWVDAGFNRGPILANEPCSVAIDYAFDTKSHTCQIKRITDNGVASSVSLAAIPGVPSSWTEGAYVQLQLGSMPSAGPWQMMVSGEGDGLCLEWS